MREIAAEKVVQAVRDLCIEANTELPEGHLAAMRRALEEEESPHGREVLTRLLQNADVALYAYPRACDEGGYELGDYPNVRAWPERVEALPGYLPPGWG